MQDRDIEDTREPPDPPEWVLCDWCKEVYRADDLHDWGFDLQLCAECLEIAKKETDDGEE